MEIYVAHPYGGKEENKKIVEEFIKRKVKEYPHHTFISPIHTFGYMYNDIEYIKGIYMCIDLLETCDALMIPAFDKIVNSVGCLIELGFARGKGIPIIDWEAEPLEIKMELGGK